MKNEGSLRVLSRNVEFLMKNFFFLVPGSEVGVIL